MNISKEAIEAGARALLAITPAENLPYVTVPRWEDLHGMDQIYYTRLATAALTAAAPLIAAEAVRAELMEVALKAVEALCDDPEHHETQGPHNGYVSVDNLRAAIRDALGS